jgi:hypothetical protein
MVFSLGLGMNQVWAQPEGEEEEEEVLQARPNPMERPVDLSEPAMKPGQLLLPAEKVGISQPAMKPGTTSPTGSTSSSPSVPGATPGGPRPGEAGYDPLDPITLKDGRIGIMQKGADGKMQFFLLQGKSQVLAPDGSYQLPDGQSFTVSAGQASMPIDPIGKGGAVKSPDQMQMPGKMR